MFHLSETDVRGSCDCVVRGPRDMGFGDMGRRSGWAWMEEPSPASARPTPAAAPPPTVNPKKMSAKGTPPASSDSDSGDPDSEVGSQQSFSEMLPGTLVLPVGQMLHDPAPETALYVPATHAVHVPPFGPVKPALHAQSEKASLPAGEDDPAMMPSRQLAVHVASYF